MARESDFVGSNQKKAKNPPSSFRKNACSFHNFVGLLENEKKRKVQQTRMFTGLFGGELGIRTLEAFRLTAFRVMCQKANLAEFNGR